MARDIAVHLLERAARARTSIPEIANGYLRSCTFVNRDILRGLPKWQVAGVVITFL